MMRRSGISSRSFERCLRCPRRLINSSRKGTRGNSSRFPELHGVGLGITNVVDAQRGVPPTGEGVANVAIPLVITRPAFPGTSPLPPGGHAERVPSAPPSHGLREGGAKRRTRRRLAINARRSERPEEAEQLLFFGLGQTPESLGLV